MIVTDQEARQKWCPFAMAAGSYEDKPAGTGITTFNRSDSGHADKNCMCLGSDCMAWRWHDERNKTGFCGVARRPK